MAGKCSDVCMTMRRSATNLVTETGLYMTNGKN